MAQNRPTQSDLKHLVFQCTVKPEHLEEWTKLLKYNQETIQATQPGCLRTECYQSKEDPLKWFINDVFINEQAMGIHTKTDLYANLGKFLERGVMSEQSFEFPASFNVGEYEGRSVSGPATYKMQYFAFHGRCSAFCFMLQRANAYWEKEALTMPQWGALKAKQGGGLPVLHKGGKMFSESVPTANMVAKELGFYPEDPLLAHRCDFTVAAFSDVNNKLWDAPQDKVDPQAAVKKVIQELYPVFLDKIEAGLGKMKWMAGEKISVADFWVGAWYCDWVTNDNSPFKALWEPVMSKYPNVVRWGEDFKKDNCVWLATRPQDQPY